MRHALVFNIISLITFLLAVFFLPPRGCICPIEFTGGTLMEVSYAQAPDLQRCASSWKATALPIRRCRISAPRATC
jgi:preprotein translocase subunit SecF